MQFHRIGGNDFKPKLELHTAQIWDLGRALTDFYDNSSELCPDGFPALALAHMKDVRVWSCMSTAPGSR